MQCFSDLCESFVIFKFATLQPFKVKQCSAPWNELLLKLSFAWLEELLTALVGVYLHKVVKFKKWEINLLYILQTQTFLQACLIMTECVVSWKSKSRYSDSHKNNPFHRWKGTQLPVRKGRLVQPRSRVVSSPMMSERPCLLLRVLSRRRALRKLMHCQREDCRQGCSHLLTL